MQTASRLIKLRRRGSARRTVAETVRTAVDGDAVENQRDIDAVRDRHGIYALFDNVFRSMLLHRSPVDDDRSGGICIGGVQPKRRNP